MRIELVYDPDCQNVELARRRLATILAELGCPRDWQEWERGAAETPARVENFTSPSIVVNGVDVEGPVNVEGPLGAAGPACRLYRTRDGAPDDAPSTDAIRHAVAAALPRLRTGDTP